MDPEPPWQDKLLREHLLAKLTAPLPKTMVEWDAINDALLKAHKQTLPRWGQNSPWSDERLITEVQEDDDEVWWAKRADEVAQAPKPEWHVEPTPTWQNTCYYCGQACASAAARDEHEESCELG